MMMARSRAVMLSAVLVVSLSSCAMGFQTSFLGTRVEGFAALRADSSSPQARRTSGPQMNVFGDIFEKAMLKIVEVKEKETTKKKLQPCPFCDEVTEGFAGIRKGSGKMTCSSCKGTGIDSALGKGQCILCEGKGSVSCGVCLGTGLVDRVRRGGTDVAGKWVGTDKVMDPLSPQFKPYILELDAGQKYVFCQCGVSTRQPFCDTVSHKAYGIKPLPFTAEGEKGTKTKASLCGCKYSNTKPYCDGSHTALGAAEAENAKR